MSCIFAWINNVVKLTSTLDCLTLSQMTNFRLFQVESLADDNFKFDENGRQLSKWVENTGKRRNCLLRAIYPFPTMFSKGLFPTGVKRCHCVGMG